MKKKNVTVIYKPAPAEVAVTCAYCKTEQRIDYEKFQEEYGECWKSWIDKITKCPKCGRQTKISGWDCNEYL